MSSHIILDTPKVSDMIFINDPNEPYDPDVSDESTIVIDSNIQIFNTKFEQESLNIHSVDYVVFKNCSALNCNKIDIHIRRGVISWFTIFERVIDMNYIPDIRYRGERISKELWRKKVVWLFWTSGAYDCYEYPHLVKNFKPDMLFPGVKIPKVSFIRLSNDDITIDLAKTNGKWDMRIW